MWKDLTEIADTRYGTSFIHNHYLPTVPYSTQKIKWLLLPYVRYRYRNKLRYQTKTITLNISIPDKVLTGTAVVAENLQI
jgi:hypothetical protein